MSSIFAPGLFKDQTCLVTGGGTGIGKAAASLFFGLGARLALIGRRLEVVQAAAQELDPTGERVFAGRCDIREPTEVEAAVEAVVQRFGRIDVLVNNAGGQFPSPAEAISAKGFEAVIRNNLVGTFSMTREVAVRAMIPQKGGAIVNVIANVERGFPGMAHTGAARAGVDNLTRTLAVEWVMHGIRVNAVAPGVIGTDAIGKYDPSMIAHIKKATPMKRLGTAEEVADAIVFLASRGASFVSGETLYVDGVARLWGETWPIPDPSDA